MKPGVHVRRRIGAFPVNRVDLDSSVKCYHLPTWKRRDDPTRIAALREISLKAGRDPRIATLAVQILQGSPKVWQRLAAPFKAEPREYEKQAALLLKWVQHHIYYINEPGERLQDPIYTLKVGYGDCDDMAMLLAALYESCRLPWRFTLSGKSPSGQLIRWTEGERKKRAQWSHIYLTVGWPTYRPTTWRYAEPTLRSAALGWDIVQAKQRTGKVVLPELAGIEDNEDRVPLIVEERQAFFPYVAGEVRKRLNPREVVPALIASFVIGGIAEYVRQTWKKGKK